MIPIPEFAFRLVGSLVFGSIAIALRGAADVASECGADWLSEYVKTGLLDRLEKHLTGSGKMLNHDVERAVFNALTRSILDISQSYNLVADRAKGRSDFIDGLEQILRQENLNFLVDLDQKQLVELIHGKEEDILASMLRRFDQAVVAHEGEGAWEFTERFQVRDETFRREFAQHFPQKLRFYFVEELKDNQRAWVGFMHFMLNNVSSDLRKIADAQKDATAQQSALQGDLLKIQSLLNDLSDHQKMESRQRETLIEEINALQYLRAFFSDISQSWSAGQARIEGALQDLDQKTVRRAAVPKPEDLVLPLPTLLNSFLELLDYRRAITDWYGSEQQKESIIGWINTPSLEPDLALIYEEGGIGKSRLALQLCLELMQQNWWANFTDPARPVDFDYPVEGFLFVIDYPEEKIASLNKFLHEIFHTRCQKPVRVLLLSRREQAWWESGGRIQTNNVIGHQLTVFRLERIGSEKVLPLFREACYKLCLHYRKPLPKFEDGQLEAYFFGTDESKQVYSKPLFVLMAAVYAVYTGDYSLQLEYHEILKQLYHKEKSRIHNAAASVGLNPDACSRAVALAALTGYISSKELTLLCRPELFFGFVMEADFFDKLKRLYFYRKGQIDALKPDVFGAVFLLEELKSSASEEEPVEIDQWIWEILKAKLDAITEAQQTNTNGNAGKTSPSDLLDGIARLVYDTVVVYGDVDQSLLRWMKTLARDPAKAKTLEPFTKDHRPSPYLRPLVLVIDEQLVKLETSDTVQKAERLTNYAFHLFWQGDKKTETAFTAAAEAVLLWREKYAENPDKYGLNLVHALEIYSLSTSSNDEAMAANRDAIAISHKIHKSRNDFESADRLGQALKERVNRLREKAEFKKARRLSNLAIKLYESMLAIAEQGNHHNRLEFSIYRNSLARLLHNRALTFNDLGMREEALHDFEQAVTLRRQLVYENPWRYEPEFALSLEQYSQHLNKKEEYAASLEMLDECIQVKRRLLKSNPSKNLISLLNLKFLRSKLLEQMKREAEIDTEFMDEFNVIKSYLDRNAIEFSTGDLSSLSSIGYHGSQGKLLHLAIKANDLTIQYLENLRPELTSKGSWSEEYDVYIAIAFLNNGNAIGKQENRHKAIVCYSDALRVVANFKSENNWLLQMVAMIRSICFANRAIDSLKIKKFDQVKDDVFQSLHHEKTLRQKLKGEWPVVSQHKDLIASYKILAGELEEHFPDESIVIHEYKLELCEAMMHKSPKSHSDTFFNSKFAYVTALLKLNKGEKLTSTVKELVKQLDEWLKREDLELSAKDLAWKKNTFVCSLIQAAEVANDFDDELQVGQMWVVQALDYARNTDDRHALAYMLDTLGHLQMILGERAKKGLALLEKAKSNFEQSESLLVQDNDESALKEVRNNLERVNKALAALAV